MKTQEIKFSDKRNKYSILIGNNILKKLSHKVKSLCPQTKKVALKLYCFNNGATKK